MLIAALIVAAVGCDGGMERGTLPSAPLGVDGCVVWIHGRSESGEAARVVDRRGELSPDGNAELGDGFEWRYGDERSLAAATGIVADAIDVGGCTDVVVAGFSNGAAFVAAMWCAGEAFGGRLVGVVIDDPVTDDAVEGCEPASTVPAALYWTGALANQSQPGTRCVDVGFTCAGDELIGIAAYAAELGVDVTDSPFDEHRWYRDASEIDRWLG